MMAMFKDLGFSDDDVGQLIEDLQSGKIKGEQDLQVVIQNKMMGAEQKPAKSMQKEEVKGEAQGSKLNGALADPSWAEPAIKVKSNELARKGLFTNATKTEYLDSDTLLKNKVNLMA